MEATEKDPRLLKITKVRKALEQVYTIIDPKNPRPQDGMRELMEDIITINEFHLCTLYSVKPSSCGNITVQHVIVSGTTIKRGINDGDEIELPLYDDQSEDFRRYQNLIRVYLDPKKETVFDGVEDAGDDFVSHIFGDFYLGGDHEDIELEIQAYDQELIRITIQYLKIAFHRTSVVRYYVDQVKTAHADHQKTAKELGDLKTLGAITQNRLLPQGPYIDVGFHIYSFITQLEGLGGDGFWYRRLSKKDNRVFFGIIDVTGHGGRAAEVVNATLPEVSKFQFVDGASSKENLAEFIEFINRFIKPYKDAGFGFVMLCGICDPKTQKTVLFNANTRLPILLTPNGNANELKIPRNMILGDKEPYYPRLKEITLEKDSYLIAYSDGLVESLNNEGLTTPAKTLCRKIEELNGKHPNEVLKAIESIYTHHTLDSPDEDNDDTTILVIYLGDISKWDATIS